MYDVSRSSIGKIGKRVKGQERMHASVGSATIPSREEQQCLLIFNDWGGGECRKFVPVSGGDGTKIAPTGDIFDQSPGEMS